MGIWQKRLGKMGEHPNQRLNPIQVSEQMNPLVDLFT